MSNRILFAVFTALVPSLAFGQVSHFGDYQDGGATPARITFNTKDPATGEVAAATSLAVELRQGATTVTTAETLDDNAHSINGYHECLVDLTNAGIVAGDWDVMATAGTCGTADLTGSILARFSVDRFGDVTEIFTTPGSDPNAIPGPTASIGEKIDYLFAISTGRKRSTAALIEWWNAAGTKIAEAVIDPRNSTEVNQQAAEAP